MEFTKFGSLSNVKQKLINHIERLGKSNIWWFVTEKVHGANFGVHLFPDGDIRFSRRTAYIEEGESFYAYENVTESASTCIKRLKELFGGEHIVVFGELFGGAFYGESSSTSVKIQKEIQYTPNTEFFAFSLNIDGKYIPTSEAHMKLSASGFNVVPVLAKVRSIVDALNIPNDSDSVIPKILGYEATKGNTMEGTVISPAYEAISTKGGESTLVLKNKNLKFSEKKRSEPKVVPTLSDTAKEILDAILDYVTSQRLHNVLSKELSVEQKDFSRISGLLTQDSLEEYCTDNDTSIIKLKDSLGTEWTLVARVLNRESTVVVREYWIEEF